MVDFAQLLAKVDGFTDTEDVCLAVWLEAVLRAGFDVQKLKVAREILRTGLDLEHWQSVLDPDPDKQSDKEKAQTEKFAQAFRAALAKFQNPVIVDPAMLEKIERPNAP